MKNVRLMLVLLLLAGMTSGAWADGNPRKVASRPRASMVAQAPSAEAPSTEAPSKDAPNAGSPTKETPGAETPNAGAPSKEAPGAEAPNDGEGKQGEHKGVRHARSERGEMTADRPELGVSSRTVGLGRVQLEMETEYEQETRDGETITRVVAPNALLRFGVTEDLELRVASNLLVFEGSQSGLANATLGVKWNFLEGEPSLGMLAQATLPVGNPALRVEDTQYQLALLGDFPLAKNLEARVNAGASSAGSVGSGQRIDPIGSVALFTKVGKSVELHAEYGYLGASRFRGGTGQVFDAGLALIVDEDTQIDLAGFKGLAGETYDWKVVLGFGHRF